MPQYVYECEECGDAHFEIHSIKDDPEIKCPKCDAPCFRVIQPVHGYVKGNCYLNRSECKKQANLSLLQDDDPYSRHRQPGEKDELISKIKKGKKGKPIQINGLNK